MPIKFYGPSQSAATIWSGIETIGGQKTFSDTLIGDISSNGTSYFTDICANRIYSNPDAGQALIIDSSLIIPDACFNILSNGNVGIGTESPTTKLEVKGDGRVFRLRGAGGQGTGHAYMSFFPYDDIKEVQIGFRSGANGDDGIFQFWNGAGGSSTRCFQFLANVGIGGSSAGTTPNANLDIKQPNRLSGAVNFTPNEGLRITWGSTAYYWAIYYSTNNHLRFNYSGNMVGYIDNNHTTPGEMNFTGQHRCILNKNLDETSKGLIVSSTGKYININNSLNTNINESLPICNITNTDNDKKVFGVISDKEDTNSNRDYSTGNFVSCYEKTNKNEQRMFINSLGEGAIWVCNKNGNVENGDYISSSSVAGYGMKQTLNEDFLTRYTVAKITCDCHFSLTKIVKQKLKVINQSDSSGNAYTDIDYDTNGDVQYEDDLDANGAQQMIFPFETRFLQADATQITEAEYNSKLGASEEVYIACFVGCTYHCG